MKKMLLFALIGAVVLFMWQFMSFAFPNFHKSSSQYTPLQDSILAKINTLGLKEGMYMLGQADPNLPHDQMMKVQEEYSKKPWASLNYQTKNSMDMTKPIIRSLVNSFLVSMLLFWVFTQQKTPTLKSRLFFSLAIGMIGFFFIPYSNFIWYKEPDIFAYFFDGIFPWLILGLIGHKMAK